MYYLLCQDSGDYLPCQGLHFTPLCSLVLVPSSPESGWLADRHNTSHIEPRERAALHSRLHVVSLILWLHILDDLQVFAG